ncbi:hypothetical protein CEXT_198111 [Caerostris extrusa]|uniref:Uncharacterized protein n=1 Tax=Caerostris extrusa TaxID=172846 RepID=A0AAV4NA58_CAEEX|nr:hypothetical protein CEXT_198111 [Caerostris extrusa]
MTTWKPEEIRKQTDTSKGAGIFAFPTCSHRVAITNSNPSLDFHSLHPPPCRSSQPDVICKLAYDDASSGRASLLKRSIDVHTKANFN